MKNKRSIIIGIVAAGLLAGAGVLGFNLLTEYRAQHWRAQGIAADKAGDYEEAVQLLGRYISRHKDDAEALIAFIDAREKADVGGGQQYGDTIAALKMLVGLQPDRIDNRRHLAELFLKIGRRPEALDTVNALLAYEKLREPKNGPVTPDVASLSLKTEIQTRSGQYSDALATATLWIAAAPNDLNAHMSFFLAHAMANHQGDFLMNRADQLEQQHPADPKFEVLAGYARVLAAGILEQHDAQVRSRLDDSAQQQGAQERQLRTQAATLYQSAAAHPDASDFFITTLTAQLEGVGLTQDAITFLQSVAPKTSSPAVRQLLASRLWQNGQWAEVVSTLSNLDPKDPNADPELIAFKAMALSGLKRKEESDASRAALALRKQEAARAWTLLLRRLIEQTPIDDKQVITDGLAALGSNPTDGYLAYFVGDADARLGETEAAIELWKRATAVNPTWNPPLIRLCEALLQRGRPDEAYAYASRSARNGEKMSTGVAVILARAMAAEVESGGDADAGRLLTFINEIQSKLPDLEQTRLIQIQLLAEKDRGTALKEVEAAVKKQPPYSEGFLISLAELCRRFGFDQQDACYKNSEAAWGNTPNLAYARAVARLQRNSNANEADAGLRILDGQARLSGKENTVPWQMARARFLEAAQNPGAHDAWVKLADAHPDDLGIQEAVSIARSTSRDWDFMQRTIDRLKKLTGKTALAWRMPQARVLVELAPKGDSDYNQGALLLNGIIKEYPRLPEARVLLASALMHLKQTDSAIKQLEAAYESNPSNTTLALQLAAVYQSHGDDRALKILDEVSKRLVDPRQRAMAAAIFAQRNDTSQAIKFLENPASADPTAKASEANDLFLAQLYFRKRDFDKAETLFKKVLEKPNVTSIQLASSFYLALGRRADAEQALGLLDQLTLVPGDKELIWGAFYARVGDLPAAIKQYTDATAKAPKNATAWRVLIDSELASRQIDPAFATINSAAAAIPDDKALSLLKAQAPRLREAMGDPTLPAVVLAMVRASPEDVQTGLEVIQTVLAARANNRMEQMAEQLSQLVSKHPDYLPARLQLIQCYADIHRFTEAYSVAQRAMTDTPTFAEPAKVAVTVCLAAAQAGKPMWREMDSAAQAWKKRSPDEAMAADVAMAQAKVGSGQPDVAIQVLQPYLSQVKSDPDRNAQVLTLYCSALARTGQSIEAQNLLRPLAAASPAWRVRWFQVGMSLLSESNLATNWLDQLTALLGAPSPDEMTMIAEGYDAIAVRGVPPQPQLVSRSYEWFTKAAEDPNASAQSVLSAASSAQTHGMVERAILLYRQVLSKDPNQSIAQNNLAVLLERNGGNLQEAEALALAAVRFAPHLPAFHDTLAEIRAKRGQPKLAADVERVAINLDPDNPKWRLKLADYLLSSGQAAEAEKVAEPIEAMLRGLPPETRNPLEGQLLDLKNRIKPAKATMSKAG